MNINTFTIVVCSIFLMAAFSGCAKKISDLDVVDVSNARYVVDGNTYTLHDGKAPIYGTNGDIVGHLQLGNTQTSADLDGDNTADTIVFLAKKGRDDNEILYTGIALNDRQNKPIDMTVMGANALPMTTLVARGDGVTISWGHGIDTQQKYETIFFKNVNGKQLQARIIGDEEIGDVVWRHVKWNANRVLKLVRGE